VLGDEDAAIEEEEFPSLIGSSKTQVTRKCFFLPLAVSIPHRKFKNKELMKNMTLAPLCFHPS